MQEQTNERAKEEKDDEKTQTNMRMYGALEHVLARKVDAKTIVMV